MYRWKQGKGKQREFTKCILLLATHEHYLYLPEKRNNVSWLTTKYS